MCPRQRTRAITFRVSVEEYDEIFMKSKRCKKSLTEYLIENALTGNDPNLSKTPIDSNTGCDASLKKIEETVQQLSQDSFQLLRRFFVIFRINRFMLSEFYELKGDEVDKLLKEYMDDAIKSIPERQPRAI